MNVWNAEMNLAFNAEIHTQYDILDWMCGQNRYAMQAICEYMSTHIISDIWAGGSHDCQIINLQFQAYLGKLDLGTMQCV